MSNIELDEAIRDDAKEAVKKISNSLSNCNHKFLYKYQTFNSKYIEALIRTIDMNFIFLSKLALFEKDDIHEYQLHKEYFNDGLKNLIEMYNGSDIRDKTKILCLSYEYPNEYLIKNYSENFGFIIKYNAHELKKHLIEKYKDCLMYGDVKYVDNKSKYISHMYGESFFEYIKKLKDGIQNKNNNIFLELTYDVINDLSYYLNSTNFLLKDKRFSEEKEFRFVFTNLNENENYINCGKNRFVEEIIILNPNIFLYDKNKMNKLIDVCNKNNITYRIDNMKKRF